MTKDYCNAALAGLPQTTIAPLQRVQNAAARLVFELGPREYVTPCLLQLPWLPVRWRIQFKLCCIMHSVFNGKCPAYLSADHAFAYVIIINWLLVTMTSHQVRQARLFLRWSVCMEQTAWRHLHRIWHCKLSKAFQNSLFQLMYFYQCTV